MTSIHSASVAILRVGDRSAWHEGFDESSTKKTGLLGRSKRVSGIDIVRPPRDPQLMYSSKYERRHHPRHRRNHVSLPHLTPSTLQSPRPSHHASLTALQPLPSVSRITVPPLVRLNPHYLRPSHLRRSSVVVMVNPGVTNWTRDQRDERINLILSGLFSDVRCGRGPY